MNRLVAAVKALSHLGLQPVALNALYRFGLATGHYKRVTSRQLSVVSGQLIAILPLPRREELLTVLGEEGQEAAIAEADEIVAGKGRLFGSEPVELRLTLPGKLEHWTAYETDPSLLSNFYSLIPDVKYIWEPARFGWAFTLGRAYHLSGDEKYAEAFWHYTETFLDANPPYLGPQWMSGQEAAIRLMAFVWAAQVFGGSQHSTPGRLSRLAQSVAQHAARIPPTLVYARSQQNNHLLTEAAGLLTAGLALPDAPGAARWRALAWHWLNEGLQSQIDSYGEYAQHSTNYHRLMLQVALWANALNTKGTKKHQGFSYSPVTRKRLAAATHWLLSLLDTESGRTPNLGANDGACIFPLTICPFPDYRPVLHAAARLFLNYDLPRGPWDETALWFGLPLESPRSLQLPRYLGDQLYGQDSWASLRTAQFTSRPSHADQLHVDLWWRGLNVAQDAGTYLYNAPAPWENSLTSALVHNTVTVDGRDQMTRAGRFLYVDWVNAYRRGRAGSEPGSLQSVSGRLRVHRSGGYRHTRSAAVYAGDRWVIKDEILPYRFSPFQSQPSIFRLHWLLPDWEWELEKREEKITVRLKSPHGPMLLTIHPAPLTIPCAISLVRAGETVYGSESASPIRGWVSPTYGVKVPALSLAVTIKSTSEVQFNSEFIFP